MDLTKDLLNFITPIVSFQDCDGYAKIEIVSEREILVHMEDGWECIPPHHFEVIDSSDNILEVVEYIQIIDKIEEDLWKAIEEARDDDERAEAINVQKDYYKEELCLFIIDAKAGLVAQESKYKVRTGFHTRVASRDLLKALNRTKKLWEEEHNRYIELNPSNEEGVKESKESHPDIRSLEVGCAEFKDIEDIYPLRKVDKKKYYLNKALSERSLKDLADFIENDYLCPSLKKENLETIDYWKIFKTISEVKKDIEIVENILGEKLYDPRFIDYLNRKKLLKEEKDKAFKGRTTISVDEALTYLDSSREEHKKFLKLIGEVSEDDEDCEG